MNPLESGQRSWWLTPALVTAFLLPLVIILHAIRGLTVYLTADAGHALADADALMGHGVRSMGHAPLFPAITAAVMSVTTDLTALRVLAILGSLAMSGAFYFFVRGRSGSPFAEIVGTLLFGLAPPTAEAIGYFGIVMLLGIAFAIAAMRALDDWLAAPSPKRAAFAGLLVALAAFTHTVGFVWLVQVSAIAGLVELARMYRSARENQDRIRSVMRTAPIVAVFTVIAAVEATSFLGGVANPARFHPSLENLNLIGDFGFRGRGLFWMWLLVGAVVILPLSMRVDERVRRLAVWSFAAGFVAVANLVAIEADVQYQARQTYLLALPAAAAIVCVGALLRRIRIPAPTIAATSALVVGALGLALIGERAFNERLSVTTPYYGHVQGDELAALRWLRGHRGTTLVTGRGDQLYSGSSYAWMIEGFAKARSFAPAEGFTNLYEEQRLESDDAAAFVAGATVTVNRGLMAGVSAHDDSVHVLRRLDHAWFPIANITVAAEGEQRAVAITKTASGLSISSPGSRLLVDRLGDEAPGRGGQTRTAGAVSFHTTPDAVVISQHAALSERLEARSFATSSLLAKHDVRWVWVWDDDNSDLLSDLLDRGFVAEHRDGNVVILRPPRV